MENNLNNKTFNLFNMGKKFLFMLSILLIISTAYGQDALILKYEFEENTGNVIFDSSGNGFLASTNGISWTGNEAFGDYALDFDGGNDWIETTLPLNTVTDFTLGGWIYPHTGTQDTIVDIDNGGQNKLELIINGVGLELEYRDDSQNIQSLTIRSGDFPLNTYTHIAVHINSVTETYSYWENGNPITVNATIPNGYNSFATVETVRIGANVAGGADYDGFMDALFLLNFCPSDNQILELFQQNTITIINEVSDEEQTIEGVEEIDLIIDNYNPFQNEDFHSSDLINVNLNSPANCEFYVNSQLYQSGENQISYSWEHNLPFGDYEGVFYCYYDTNTTRYYELTDQFPFSVVRGNNSFINFFITGLDFNPNDENLYIVTPCIKRVASVMGIGEGADKVLNEGETYYFQQLQNGQATFHLTENTHEFCLINGHLEYSQNGFTQDFNINNVYGFLELGEFNLPSNVTQSYVIETELLEIYDNTDPKAWGKTWATIISGLILLGLGIIILIAGVSANNGKVVIGGVLLCLAGAGVEFTGLLGLII